MKNKISKGIMVASLVTLAGNIWSVIQCKRIEKNVEKATDDSLNYIGDAWEELRDGWDEFCENAKGFFDMMSE